MQDCTANVPAIVVITVARNFNTFATLVQFTLIIFVKLILKHSKFIFIFFGAKENESKETLKTSWLRGRLSDFPNHSMNSLCSNSISYFVAWLKPRLNGDSENPTVSKDLFVRNVFLET